MNTRKKAIARIIGLGMVIMATVIGSILYSNRETVKINRQLELAQQYLFEEDYEQAIETFEAVIEIDFKSIDAYLGLAEAYAAIDDLENAVKILEKASDRIEAEEILAQLEKYTSILEQQMQAAALAEWEAEKAADAGNDSNEVDRSTYQSEQTEIYLGETDNDKWKQAYINYLHDNEEIFKENFPSYELIYVDIDDIPEMVLHGKDEALGCIIINYSDGTVHETQLIRSYYTYIEHANLLCNFWGHMGVASHIIYSIIDGEMTVIAEGNMYFGFDDEENNDSYEWNGREVTQAEYDVELRTVYDSDKAMSNHDFNKYTYDEIVNAIANL